VVGVVDPSSKIGWRTADLPTPGDCFSSSDFDFHRATRQEIRSHAPASANQFAVIRSICVGIERAKRFYQQVREKNFAMVNHRFPVAPETNLRARFRRQMLARRIASEKIQYPKTHMESMFLQCRPISHAGNRGGTPRARDVASWAPARTQ
jgi:hypothetical protein